MEHGVFSETVMMIEKTTEIAMTIGAEVVEIMIAMNVVIETMTVATETMIAVIETMIVVIAQEAETEEEEIDTECWASNIPKEATVDV